MHHAFPGIEPKMGPTYRIWLLNPGPLELTAISIIVHVSAPNTDTREPSVSKRRRPNFETLPVIMIRAKCLAVWGERPGCTNRRDCMTTLTDLLANLN